MTVSELIEELKKYPENLTMICVGFTTHKPAPITTRSIVRDKHKLILVGDDFRSETDYE